MKVSGWFYSWARGGLSALGFVKGNLCMGIENGSGEACNSVVVLYGLYVCLSVLLMFIWLFPCLCLSLFIFFLTFLSFSPPLSLALYPSSRSLASSPYLPYLPISASHYISHSLLPLFISAYESLLNVPIQKYFTKAMDDNRKRVTRLTRGKKISSREDKYKKKWRLYKWWWTKHTY